MGGIPPLSFCDPPLLASPPRGEGHVGASRTRGYRIRVRVATRCSSITTAISIFQISRAIWPHILVMLIVLFLTTYIPTFALMFVPGK